MNKNIKQSVVIKASPHEVYEALMDSKKHSAFTGAKAKISPKVGGTFTAYDGYSSGKNLELVKDKKIVQSWTASDWKDGEKSTVTFLLKPLKGSTQIVFTHQGVPANQAKSVADGWKEYYWQPLKKFLE